MRPTISILIIARSGSLRNGLEALLRSIAPAHIIASVDDAGTMMSWIATHQPDVVLLDFRLLEDEPLTALQRIKLVSPSTRRIVFADDVQQQAIATPAAEEVLLKGSAPVDLVTIIERILPGE